METSNVVVVTGLVAGAVLIGGVLYWGSASSTVPKAAVLQPTPPPAGFVEYQSGRGVAFYYPEGATVKEIDEGAGAYSLIIEDLKNERGFQVYVIPYREQKITDERFYADVPSGVRTDVAPRTVGLDKIEAVTFVSSDLHLGETREVWFIHAGRLYEVTTFKNVGPWFETTLASWRFI